MTREMKDSGVEWIGGIPSYWRIAPLHRLFFISAGGDAKNEFYQLEKDETHLYPVYTNSKDEYNVYSYTSKPMFPENSITVSGRGEIGRAFFRNEPFDAIIRLLVLVPKVHCSPEFYTYFINDVLVFNTDSSAVGQLSTLQISPYRVAVPPLDEQKKIVDILNVRVGKINNVIKENKNSIKELKKYKQSIITEVVTKGLDSNVEMKDSGIDWIGKIPKSWNLIKINRLFSIKKEIANQTGYDVLSVTQRGLKVKDITQNEGQMAADYSKYQIVQPDDFVMNHMDLLTGWVDLAVQEGVTSPDYRVFYNKQKELVFNKFYLYVLQICYLNKIFYGLGQGVSNFGRWRLQTDKFLNFYLPLPTIEEQIEIVSYLDSQTNKVDSLIQEKERVIEELDTYKQSLIYEYVTGKKEV